MKLFNYISNTKHYKMCYKCYSWVFFGALCIYHDPLLDARLLLTVLVAGGRCGGDSSRIISPLPLSPLRQPSSNVPTSASSSPPSVSSQRIFVYTHTQNLGGDACLFLFV